MTDEQAQTSGYLTEVPTQGNWPACQEFVQLLAKFPFPVRNGMEAPSKLQPGPPALIINVLVEIIFRLIMLEETQLHIIDAVNTIEKVLGTQSPTSNQQSAANHKGEHNE